MVAKARAVSRYRSFREGEGDLLEGGSCDSVTNAMANIHQTRCQDNETDIDLRIVNQIKRDTILSVVCRDSKVSGIT
jgi:hypothetical protein